MKNIPNLLLRPDYPNPPHNGVLDLVYPFRVYLVYPLLGLRVKAEAMVRVVNCNANKKSIYKQSITDITVT